MLENEGKVFDCLVRPPTLKHVATIGEELRDDILNSIRRFPNLMMSDDYDEEVENLGFTFRFFSKKVSKLEDGCGPHCQATYVTWKGWSSRLEVIYLHKPMHSMKCNNISV